MLKSTITNINSSEALKKAAAKKTEKAKKYNIDRTPVVAVMGHVDHGKTTLLDTIRGTKVVDTEVGGITQNTRAHQITHDGHKITFIDTPGHEAFSDMRSRGAKVTDIVLLVVAADDGVQPQTKESIKFALEEKVPVIVAINKIDMPGKNLNKLKQELTSAGLQLEEYGGDVIVNEISALKNQGITELLESILLVTELHELKQSTMVKDAVASAFVLEAKLDDKLGPVALVLVKAGVIKAGQFVVHEQGVAKIRSLLDDKQQQIMEGQQSDPVWIIGMDKVLNTGEYINAVLDEKIAKKQFKEIEHGERELVLTQEEAVAEPQEGTEAENDLLLLAGLLDDKKQKAEVKLLKVIVRTSVRGTLDVVTKQLMDLNDENVQVQIIDQAVGQVNEKDIARARAGRAIILSFQQEVPAKIADYARKEKVLIKNYEIIYELVDEIAEAMDSLAGPITEKVEVARSVVKEVFILSNKSVVAGCEVIKGTVIKGYRVFVERGGKEIHTAKITSLKQHKEEVKEIKKGQQCGIILEPSFADLQEGDEIVCFKIEVL